MIKIILGMILLFLPFLLIDKFKNKKYGFFYILSFLFGFHLIIAIITQTFSIFNYWVIISINLIVGIFVIIKSDFKKLIRGLKKIKIDWMLIFIILVLFIALYSVHYNYTGIIRTLNNGSQEVENMNYGYPYLSDEWVSISLVKYSIRFGRLPLVNPLEDYNPYPNIGFALHSFISEIMLLLNLDPLNYYTILSLFFGILICLLVYFILRFNRVGKFASGIACLSVLYIVNSGNFPGLWTLIPITIGIVCMLLGFLFMSINSKKMSLFLGLLTLIFYPPLAIFYIFSLIGFFIFKNIPKKEKIKEIFIYFIFAGTIIILFTIFLFSVFGSIEKVFTYLSEKLFYRPFSGSRIVDFLPWKVMPISILCLAVIGFLKDIKKKTWLIFPIIFGLFIWWVYSFLLWRFTIGHSRLAFLIAILVTILGGFGLHYLIKFLREKSFIKKYNLIEILGIIVLVGFFIFSFSYTERDNWRELKSSSVFDERVIGSVSAANNYLHEDDLEIFKDIKEKNFLSIPWKGLVIGATTNNYPLDSKGATIFVQKIKYNEFISSSCEDKIMLAKKYEIDYVYSKEFNCNGFELKAISSEGWCLYQADNNLF